VADPENGKDEEIRPKGSSNWGELIQLTHPQHSPSLSLTHPLTKSTTSRQKERARGSANEMEPHFQPILMGSLFWLHTLRQNVPLTLSSTAGFA